MLRQFIVLVVVAFAAVVLSACGGSNVVENARNAAQELFLPDQGATLNVNGQPMTRREVAAFWASESAKLVVCESVASKEEALASILFDAFNSITTGDNCPAMSRADLYVPAGKCTGP